MLASVYRRETRVVRQVNGEAMAVDYAIEDCFAHEAVVPERKLVTEALKRGIGAVTVEKVTREMGSRPLIWSDVAGRKDGDINSLLKVIRKAAAEGWQRHGGEVGASPAATRSRPVRTRQAGLERKNGKTLLAFFSPFPARRGGGVLTRRCRVRRPPLHKANRPVLPPDESWGETQTEPTAAGVQRPTIRRRIRGPDEQQGRWASGLPSPSLPPVIKSGAAGSPKGRASASRWNARPASAGVATSYLFWVRDRRFRFKRPGQPLPIAGHEPGKSFDGHWFRYAQLFPFDIGKSLAVPGPEDTQDCTASTAEDFAARRSIDDMVAHVDRVGRRHGFALGMGCPPSWF